MEDALRSRIKEILSDNKVTQNQLADRDSALQNRLSRQLNHGASVTFQTISIITKRFPMISIEWLLLGKGDKYGSKCISNSNTLHTHTIKDSNVNNGGTQTIGDSKAQEERIAKLEAQNRKLEERIDKLISILESK